MFSPHCSPFGSSHRFLTRALCGIAAIVIGALGAFSAHDVEAAIHSRFPPTQLDPNIPVPIIAFDQTRYDFGQIAAGQSVEHTFLVTNTGRATLRIEKPHVSCGCTSATIGKLELKPGESTELLAVYTPEKGFTGAMRKSVLIVSNDPTHSKFTLRLAGNVRPPASSDSNSSPIAKADQSSTEDERSSASSSNQKSP